MIKFIVLLFILYENVNSENNIKNEMRCCDDYEHKNIMMEDYNCSNGNNLRLTCSKYIIDPSLNPSGEFISITDDNEMFYEGQYYEYGRFCVVDLDIDDGLYEIAFVCFDENPNDSIYIFIVKGILLLLSFFFAGVTLFIYIRYREFRDTQDKVIMMALGGIIIFFLSLGLMQIFPLLVNSSFCAPIAFIIYGSVIVHFAWLNCVIANVWKRIVFQTWTVNEKYWYLGLHIYAWGISLLLFSICLIDNLIGGYNSPGFGEGSCWFKSPTATWNYLFIPLLIMLLINVILITWVIYFMIRSGSDSSISPSKRMVFCYRVKLYSALFIMGGLTWIFEILSHKFKSHKNFDYHWFITDILNSCYGFVIFLILIVFRKKSRRILSGEKFLCCRISDYGTTNNKDDCETSFHQLSEH